MRQNLKDLLEAVTGQLFNGGRIVELGAYQVPGQEGFADLRPFFPGGEFIGCDMRKGPGVDVIEDIHRLSFPNGFADWVICFDTLEHVYDPLLAVKELIRILSSDGVLIISSVMNFQIHDYPGDYWRFTPEIFWHMLAKELPWRKVFYQGDPLNPHTVIGIGSRKKELSVNIPAKIDQEPLVEADLPDDIYAAAEMYASPYRPVIDFNNKNNIHTWIINNIKPSARVLELGCADGFFSRFLRDSFDCRVTGVEIDPKAAAEARKVCERILNIDLDSNQLAEKLAGETFDFIIGVEVLEHLKNPSNVLKQASRLLAPEGRLYLSAPNVAHASLALELLDGNWDPRPSGLLDRTHLRFFTLKSFLDLLNECGLAVLSLHRIVIEPEDTEFETVYKMYPREITAYLEKVNPEYRTYQFAVEARPGGGGIYACDSPAERLAVRCKELEKELENLQHGKMALDQELSRIRGGVSWRLTRPLRQFKHYLLGRKGRVS